MAFFYIAELNKDNGRYSKLYIIATSKVYIKMIQSPPIQNNNLPNQEYSLCLDRPFIPPFIMLSCFISDNSVTFQEIRYNCHNVIHKN